MASLAGATVSVVVALSSPAEAARRRGGGGYNPPYAAMVVDVKTGRVLHAENEDALRYPASVTKVMTLYLLFEQLERGRLSLQTPLHVSANAAAQAPSKLFLDPGQTIAVEDAIKALVTKSANDVAVAVAENLAGSVEQFAEMMTRKARELGMTRTVFRNPSGLPDPAQVTTARDLTILARAIQERFPRYYRYFQTRVFHYAGVAHKNHNKLLGRVEGVDGIKTGFTRASGFNLMTSARTEDRHIVAVVLGGRSGGSRDQIMASLVQSNLPRAYAGVRQAPAAEPRAPVAVAAAAVSAPLPLQRQFAAPETTAATTPAPQRRPLDLNTLRPVVASASGAGTATPSQPLRLQPNGLSLPPQAQAFAPVQQAEPARVAAAPAPVPPPAPAAAKIEDRIAPLPLAVAKAEPAEAKRDEPRRPALGGWVIQLGATDDEEKAKAMLDDAKSRSGRTLSRASAFTEKVTKAGATLYRARFSGFEQAAEAEAACKALKRGGFACFATRS
ncbi:MAG TPA: D-alanyl-D-alanine carboxypeptidase [Microvirga sp.]|nr:D-alanyl-D-alanine carboxypeptidase [Microvirga sp.]